VRELASQFGTFRNTAYSLDLDYQYNKGVRPNNELDRIEWYSTVKQQFTPQDTALLLVKYQDYESGDNFQYYDPSHVRTNYQFEEIQDPILVGRLPSRVGSRDPHPPDGRRLVNDQHVSDLAAQPTVADREPIGPDHPQRQATLGCRLQERTGDSTQPS